MAKSKKKRADKYEEKLKILGDFEDVIGVSVDVPNKQDDKKKEGFEEGQGGANEKILDKKEKKK